MSLFYYELAEDVNVASMATSTSTPPSRSSTRHPPQVSRAQELRIRRLLEKALAIQMCRENPLIQAIEDTMSANGPDCFGEGAGYEAIERRLELYIRLRGGA